MAINFPNSPSVNDTFTVGGTTFTFTGVKWESRAVVELSSDTTPSLGGNLDGGTKNINNVGIITASQFHGDGSNLTGIQGLAEPLGNTAPLNKFLKTPKTLNIGAGTSLTVENNDAAYDNLIFVKEGTIHVSVGGTFRVKQNTKLRLDVLGLF
tara:strand:- start:584 stop:1042 length:459 start_codon:yes stop_codon:yes gene_type:complete